MPSYSGVWTLSQQFQAIGQGLWPSPPLNTWFGTLSSATADSFESLAISSSGDIVAGGYRTPASQATLLAKLDKNGNLQWQRTAFPSSNSAGLVEIALDSSGNVYGYGVGYNSVNAASASWLGAYNSSGVLQSQKFVVSGNGGFSAPSGGSGMAVDTSGNFYLAISYTAGTGYPAIEIQKYNSSVSLTWGRYAESADFLFINDVKVNSANDVICLGAGPDQYALIFKYNTSGTYQWGQTLSTSGGNFYGAAIDSSNNIYACGQYGIFSNTTALLAKYNNAGTLQWQRQMSTATNDRFTDAAVDSSGNVYVVGYTGSTINCLLAKYNSSGVLQWQRTVSNSASTTMLLNSVEIDSAGYLVAGGRIIVAGNTDAFLMRVPTDGTGTGTYSFGSYTVTYASSSLTEATSTQTSSSASLTLGSRSSASGNANLTETAATLTWTAIG